MWGGQSVMGFMSYKKKTGLLMLKANSTHYCFGLTNLLFLFAEIKNKKTKNKIKNTTTMKISRQNKEKDFKKRLQRTLQILRWLFQWYIALYLCSLTTLHTKYHSLVPSLVHWWMKVKWIWSKHFKHLKEKKNTIRRSSTKDTLLSE